MRVIELPEAEDGAPSFVDAAGNTWRLLKPVNTPAEAAELAEQYDIEDACEEQACVWYLDREWGVREMCFRLPCQHRSTEEMDAPPRMVNVDGQPYVTDMRWSRPFSVRTLNPWGQPQGFMVDATRHIRFEEWRRLLEQLGWDTTHLYGVPEEIRKAHKEAEELVTYWQHIRSRRNSEERLQYPMRSENYRYSLQQETQMRPRLVEQGFCEALLDEGYASYVRGDIYEARRATNNHNVVVLEAVRCWVRDWKNRNPNASAVKRDESVDREAVAELLDW